MKIAITVGLVFVIALVVWAITRSRAQAGGSPPFSDVAAVTGNRFSLGTISINAPDGWRQAGKSDDRLVLRSPDDQQQLTLSTLMLEEGATFEDFNKLCAARLDEEKQELSDGFINPAAPQAFQKEGAFGMFYSGGDKKDHRMFSTYLSLKGKQFLTVYLEGLAACGETMDA